ncbi:MFS transporter [Sulfolobales archaeon HS-7]|nr:MFS transporter [Sulfolobales archaeon HS-7]
MENDRGFFNLLLSRILRSVGLIYASLASPLYLSALGLNPAVIGVIFFGVIGFTAGLSLLLGYLGDRFGYKKSLIIGDLFPLIGLIMLGLASKINLIIPALIITGISGNAGAARGAFSPGLTALVVSNWKDEKERVSRMGTLFSAAGFAGVGGSLMISAIKFIPLPTVTSYRILFEVSAVLLAFSVANLVYVKEEKREKKTTKFITRSSANYISRVIISNAVTGFGLGLSIPLLTLWFKVFYHASPFDIGIIFTSGSICSALGSLVATRIKGNPLKLAYITRIVNGVLLVAMGLSPYMVLAGALYSIRAINAGIGLPNRNVTNIRGVSAEDYGSASSLQGVVTRVSQMSSGISGYLLEDFPGLPLELGGLLQALGGYLYMYLLSKRAEPPQVKKEIPP